MTIAAPILSGIRKRRSQPTKGCNRPANRREESQEKQVPGEIYLYKVRKGREAHQGSALDYGLSSKPDNTHAGRRFFLRGSEIRMILFPFV